jgi:hypothetical protein
LNRNAIMNRPSSTSCNNPFFCLALTIALGHWGATGLVRAAATSNLREALTFHASFDHGPDADFGKGDRQLFNAPSMKQPRTGTPGLPANGVVSIAQGEGKVGDALRFHRKAPEMVFFRVENNLAYAKSNWSGTVSFWLRLNPDVDLEPGYCDPIQITPREWNDAAFWVTSARTNARGTSGWARLRIARFGIRRGATTTHCRRANGRWPR